MRACAVFTNIKLFVLCVYSCTAVDIVGLVGGVVFQSISTETKMKHDVSETEEVWKSLEERERAEEEREGGEGGEARGGCSRSGWRDEADFWPCRLL